MSTQKKSFWTCDLCGVKDETNVNDRPSGWNYVEFKYGSYYCDKYDICQACDKAPKPIRRGFVKFWARITGKE
jgi:hypothetical protein